MYKIIKRIIDISGAIAGLIVFAPLMLILAVIIRLDSKGPAIFCQERVGRDGKKFRFYKFRTMRIGVDPYGFSPKNLNDPRVTHIGKFL